MSTFIPSVTYCRLLVQTRLGKEHVVVEICHDGPPIRGDVLEHLFVPFGTGGRPGVGLGLALTRKLALLHGGRIEVASTLGEGLLHPA